MTSNSDVNARFEEARALLEKSGITLVEVELTPPDTEEHEDELMVLLHELGTGLKDYLAKRPGARVSNLLDVVNFNKNNADTELKHFGQEHFEKALELENKKEDYLAARQRNKTWAEKTLAQGLQDVDILIGCTYGPAWESSLENGDSYASASWITSAPAIAGTPIGTIPMGLVSGLPVGLGFVSARDQEGKLITAMAQAERALGFGILTPTFKK
jgi:amidase